jgi:acyl-CoA thioester hydrolase
MDRVNIDLPEQFEFSTEVEVRMADVNAGGHLGNHCLIALLNEGHLKYMQFKGFPELLVDGRAMINADLAVIYKSEMFYGNVLAIEVAAANFDRHGLDILYRVTNKSTGKVSAVAKMGMLFFDYAERKIAEVPERFKQACGQ